MNEVFFPRHLTPARINWQLMTFSKAISDPFTGDTTVLTRPGARWRAGLDYEFLDSQKRRDMVSFINSLRGQESLFHMPDYSFAQQGSFDASNVMDITKFPETFESGIGNFGSTVTGIEENQDGYFLKITNTHRSAQFLRTVSPSTTIIANVPYAIRCYYLRPTINPLTIRLAVGQDIPNNDDLVARNMTASGIWTRWFMDDDTEVFPQFESIPTAGDNPETQAFIGLFSVARCFLIDNRGNKFTQSDDINHADWIKTRATVTDNDIQAPDATLTADKLVEDTAVNNTHQVSQAGITKSAIAEDWCFIRYVKADERTRGALRLHDAATQANRVDVNFDLTAETAVATTAGTFSNGRAFIKSLGDSWYRIAAIGKTSTETSLAGLFMLADATGDLTYTGDGVSGMHTWRAQIVQSSFPVHPQATTTAAAIQDIQTGPVIRVKGLPVSTDGLLLINDRVDINTAVVSGANPDRNELQEVTFSLNSDAFGLGLLYLSPGMKQAPPDSAVVMVRNPTGRFILEEDVRILTEENLVSPFIINCFEDIGS